jgi:hypothetical protein
MISSRNRQISIVIVLIAAFNTELQADQSFGSREPIVAKAKVADESEAGKKLTIDRFSLAYTPLGPERSHKAVYPGEPLFFHLAISGCSRTDEGECKASFEVQVVDPDGEILAKEARTSTGKSNRQRPVRWNPNFRFPPDARPGIYCIRFTFTDLHANTSTTLMETIEVKPIEFAIVSPRFFHDEQAEIPAACGGYPGQPLTVRFSLIGENTAVQNHKFDTAVKIVDESGSEAAEVSRVVEIDLRPHPNADMYLGQNLKLPYPGNYTMQWTVTEQSTGKTATRELPLVVLDPFDKH